MKKTMTGKKWFYALLVVVAFVTCSCGKKCECTIYEDGVATSSSTELVRGKSCSSISSYTDTPFGKVGVECVKVI